MDLSYAFLHTAILGQTAPPQPAGLVFDLTHIIIYTVVVVTVLAFVLLVYKDAKLLVTRPGTLGMGIGRIWAIARLSVYEAWAAKAWVVPIIWFAACCLINFLSRAFDAPMERVGLYLRVLLQGQEFLSLILLGVMTCYSFPRERDRRTIITTASKPISRLELFLGKVIGFCTVALLLLGTMTVLTWFFMLGTNEVVKSSARTELAAKQLEYDQGATGSAPPSLALRRVAAEGELHAYDYITAPTGMQVAGGIDYGDGSQPPVLLMRGGSQQKATYIMGLPNSSAHSRTGLSGLPASSEKMPFFFFNFGYTPVPGFRLTEAPKLTVRASLYDNPTVYEERTMSLGAGGKPNDPTTWRTYANWRVEDPYKFFWYDESSVSDPGPIMFDISCNTPNLNLRLYNGTDPNQSNVRAVDLDASRIPGGQNTMAALGAPRIRGFEKGDSQQIAGPPTNLLSRLSPAERQEAQMQLLEVASWRFRNIKRNDVPIDADGNFTIALLLDQDRSDSNSKTEAEIRVYRIFYPNDAFVKNIVVDEKRITELKVPANQLDPTGMDLVVDIRCLTPNHWVGALDNGVRIDRRQSFFLVNLVKSELVIFCECALVILIGVTCSLRLGWPVAMLLTGVCFLLGNIFEFVQNMTLSRSYSLLSNAEAQQVKGSLPMAYNMGSALMNASTHMLNFLVNALPNFTRFDATKFIVESRSMPWSELLGMVAALGLYSIPFIAVGYLLIRKQELA